MLAKLFRRYSTIPNRLLSTAKNNGVYLYKLVSFGSDLFYK